MVQLWNFSNVSEIDLELEFWEPWISSFYPVPLTNNWPNVLGLMYAFWVWSYVFILVIVLSHHFFHSTWNGYQLSMKSCRLNRDVLCSTHGLLVSSGVQNGHCSSGLTLWGSNILVGGWCAIITKSWNEAEHLWWVLTASAWIEVKTPHCKQDAGQWNHNTLLAQQQEEE